MTEKTRVADFLTPEQIERLLGAEYETTNLGIRRVGTGCCPLEVAFGVEKPSTTYTRCLISFGMEDQVDTNEYGSSTVKDWGHPVVEFMRGVDKGEITAEGLRSAIGLDDE